MTHRTNTIGFNAVVCTFALFMAVGAIEAKNLSKGYFVNNKNIVGEVVYVLDGDSLAVEINGRIHKVRLWGIDCPEHDQPGGDEAKAFMKQLVKDKRILFTLKDIDKYGRLVIVAENRDGVLNEQVLRFGHAWVYPYFCNEDVCQSWKRLESSAMEKRLGLWKNGSPVPPWMWKRKK